MLRGRRFFAIRLMILTLALVACSSRPAQITDDFGVTMVLVAGDIVRTGESADDSAKLNDLYVDIYEVTNQRYAECVANGACVEPENTTLYADTTYQDHPVVFVTRDMAQDYCQWREARLPTKMEWEQAAADELEDVEYYWGDSSPVCQVGARLGAPVGEKADFETGTMPVGGAKPNSFGLYDMTENAWEWVQDPFSEGDYISSPSHVSFLRMSGWSGYGPVYRRFICSFRCARAP